MSSDIIIGPAGAYGTFPAQIELEGAPYWLVRGEDGRYALLMAICPHAGGEVRLVEGMFFCPLHFWTFDTADGSCLNMQDERLMRRDVEERDGMLYAVSAPY
ncbi:Rieske (2Fe-2S) protein [Cohnella lubricantis]|uniref:Rieske (2Fe-2S) protein n=1 Tax=Cohnella lubricantis TaxID=2163172 RepID=A0A841TDG4_9BACL|nr:Rieske (2Fe-2S) protein [Cohnella lubricantis]MBB6679072.1 Rieske (2Fe-2S) protein [Cohnella lubricantis]MBP2116682.1 nitrite reductase/ring-hydroxylating ferredoxin subunit [Cohnella lubricantis]